MTILSDFLYMTIFDLIFMFLDNNQTYYYS